MHTRVTLTLRNGTHGTSATIRPEIEPAYGRLILSAAALRRAHAKLCPYYRAAALRPCRCRKAGNVCFSVLDCFHRSLAPGAERVVAFVSDVENLIGRTVYQKEA